MIFYCPKHGRPILVPDSDSRPVDFKPADLAAFFADPDLHDGIVDIVTDALLAKVGRKRAPQNYLNRKGA
jgi:hypothetical protein